MYINTEREREREREREGGGEGENSTSVIYEIKFCITTSANDINNSSICDIDRQIETLKRKAQYINTSFRPFSMTSLKTFRGYLISILDVEPSTGYNEYADWWIRWRIHPDIARCIAHLHRFCV